MKPIVFSLCLCLTACTVMAQSDKYLKAMEPNIALIDADHTADQWKNLANTFERIGEAEKNQWHPFYYAAFCHVMSGYMSLKSPGQNGSLM
ncbi:MAG: hypothetical protein N2747_00060 [Chitinophagaceae bacterium]|nr:hypothetical protein [Chitinophagaceae bacterium]